MGYNSINSSRKFNSNLGCDILSIFTWAHQPTYNRFHTLNVAPNGPAMRKFLINNERMRRARVRRRKNQFQNIFGVITIYCRTMSGWVREEGKQQQNSFSTKKLNCQLAITWCTLNSAKPPALSLSFSLRCHRMCHQSLAIKFIEW